MKRRERQQFKKGLIGWVVTAAITGIAIAIPTQSELTRVLTLLGALGLWAGGLLLFWRWWPPRILFLTPVAIACVIVLLPQKRTDEDGLRRAYQAALKHYQGAPLLPDGENRLGFDAAGVARRAFVDACLKEALRNRDSALPRIAGGMWWFDATALQIAHEHRNRSILLATVPNAVALDRSLLKPGDMVIPQDGSWLFVYLDRDRWIGPNAKTNTIEIQSADALPPSDAPLRLVRWRLFTLTDPPATPKSP